MQLHKGDLYWDVTKVATPYKVLKNDIWTEVLIIGGGMTGAMISYELGKAGMQTVVVDRVVPGYGSSWGNTGIIQYCSDMSIDNMAGVHGEKKAVDFYRLCLQAMGDLDEIVGELEKDVGYRATTSIHLANAKEDIPALKKSFDMLRKHNFPCLWLEEKMLIENYKLTAHGGLMTFCDAELNPFKLIQAIHEQNLKNGINVYKHCEITKIDEIKQDEFDCSTNEGYTIRCKKLIIATGYAKQAYPPIEPDTIRNTTYSFVSSMIDASLWGNAEMIWDTAEPYLYFRRTEDFRIIAGGKDESGEELQSIQMIQRKAASLLASIRKYYPYLETTIEHAWQSIFAESKDGLPFIGRDSKNPNKYFALGFGGNGTCYSVAAASIIKELIRHKEHPYGYTTKYPR